VAQPANRAAPESVIAEIQSLVFMIFTLEWS
jgi:hypothetical protein